jgi:hypothetical protein
MRVPPASAPPARRAGPVAAWLAVLALLAPAVGCSGYRFVRHRDDLGDVRRVAVQPLRNESYEPGVEVLVTDALLREFQRHGAVAVVREPERADLVLSGAVSSLVTRSRAFSSVELALEFEVEMGIRLAARRADGSGVEIDSTLLREWELYLASADVEVERKNREEAIRRLATLLATRIHDALAEQLATP